MKTININKKYSIYISSNNTKSLYMLKDIDTEKTIIENFNVYTFLQKVKTLVKISKKVENNVIEY